MASKPCLWEVNPPLINSANPWATTLEDLRLLYACPSTGAVTTRTSLVGGFGHDSEKHQYVFFDTAAHTATNPDVKAGLSRDTDNNGSLNSLGYSPITLTSYLGFIKTISEEQKQQPSFDGESPASKKVSNYKGFIVSVTGTPEEVLASYSLIAAAQEKIHIPLAMEINLSCPNIANKPPPAYSRDAILEYLRSLSGHALGGIPIGLKTPPYTHAAQYEALIDALEASANGEAGGVSPVSFLTATNTLGSCLVFASPTPSSGDGDSTTSMAAAWALPGAGIGGMAGAPLHPLALGNVATLRRMLGERGDKLGHIQVIGIGGVLDAGGYRRMRAVGAAVVGVGTGLGLKGLDIFGEIDRGLGGQW
ncbi:hypothetical protein B0H63DRAFT_525120 [Podospora didyma]|uniref:Dihydroorotate dehydrogenase (fumarate) n=1 Tax=Podospora didyma TaxID=330526 RepID=A0AAE0KJM3_9PEZI|nr:hypothetical protein B0H63DRAFT_525120 [Podospora didyma]